MAKRCVGMEGRMCEGEELNARGDDERRERGGV